MRIVPGTALGLTLGGATYSPVTFHSDVYGLGFFSIYLVCFMLSFLLNARCSVLTMRPGNLAHGVCFVSLIPIGAVKSGFEVVFVGIAGLSLYS